jgi:hypothetical protein
MYRTLRRALCALCIPVVILAIAQTAAGDAARLFTGSYQLSNIVDDGSKVDVTVTLTLLNTGTSDVHGGVVALFDTQPNRSLLGSFSAIKSLPRAGQATVTKTFTVPSAEFGRWQQGHDPVLEFLVPNAAGTSIAGIQAHRILKPSEENN